MQGKRDRRILAVKLNQLELRNKSRKAKQNGKSKVASYQTVYGLWSKPKQTIVVVKWIKNKLIIYLYYSLKINWIIKFLKISQICIRLILST